MPKGSGIIVIPASLRSDFIHIVGMPIHIPLESTVHIAGIRNAPAGADDNDWSGWMLENYVFR
jgi:hypothetical protein